MSETEKKAQAFLKNAEYFSLGHLPTEQPHPKTHNLSSLAQNDLPTAVELLKEVDLDALYHTGRFLPGIRLLQRDIRNTLDAGGRIYLCGCGATGRLSLFLESLWRALYGTEQIRAFMAGGDIALVHSIEDFEDFPEYGKRQLQQIGFGEGDLLISCTEGGETPYVIGATQHACSLSRRKPYFLYCNPDESLKTIQRSQSVLDNININKLNLSVGPMAIAGSTRMQASTVLQLAVGLALFFNERQLQEAYHQLRDLFASMQLEFLQEFIEREASIYQQQDYVHYLVRDYGITVFTDTTERAPTFSLAPFDNLLEKRKVYSLSYISLEDAGDHTAAWQGLLGRMPTCLDWQDINPKTSTQYLSSFDFSINALQKRKQLIHDNQHFVFHIHKSGSNMHWQLDKVKHTIDLPPLHPLLQHMLLKLLLNTHSTLVMGRLNRYTHNLMTFVSPTNGKLIDRAARYVKIILLEDFGLDISYPDVIKELFQQIERRNINESIVQRTCDALSRDHCRVNA